MDYQPNSQISFFGEEPEGESSGVVIADETPRRLEALLYEPVAEYLRSHWVINEELRDPIVEIIAHQGRRQTGGVWTRPDIAVVGICAYPFIPGKSLELSTFEIKKSVEDGIVGVYEASAHSAFAHRSFLVIHMEDGVSSSDSELYWRIVSECERLNVGLIIFSNPINFSTYRVVVGCNVRVPSMALLNKFVGAQLTEVSRQRLLILLR